MRTQYWKVLRDLTEDYGKNIMLVIGIALGIFGIGSILGGYEVLKREMTGNYMGTVPASATIELEKNITPSLVDSAAKFPGIRTAERHATLLARMKVGDRWYPLLLFVIDDFKNKNTNKFRHISGAAEPSDGSMLVERTAFKVMEASEGDELLIKTSHGEPKRIKLSGTVHDAGLAPAWQEQAGYGYISLSTLHWLGETQGFDQLRILVSEHPDSKDQITTKAEELAKWLTKNGYPVHEIQVPPPGKHPHQSQMSAVMSIFVVFSFLILILASVLVSSAMATIMMKQVRQIGVMKTIGASSGQITTLYFLMIVAICIAALVIAIPLSRFAAAAFYQQIAVLLNLEIQDSSIPLRVPLLQIVSGILIPCLAAAFPVIRGSMISVKRALDNYGVSQMRSANSRLVTRLSQPGFLSETFRLSIRNVFRHRSRLFMTLGLLAAGGAMFMTALNVSEAWDTNLKRIYQQRLYDLEVRLNDQISADSIIQKIKSVDGVSAAEGWRSMATSFIVDKSFEVSGTYPDMGHGSFSIQGLPVPTKLLEPTITEGRWLKENESNDVVLNQLARIYAPAVKIGDQIKLSVDGKVLEWNVVGFSEDVGTPATAYVSIETLNKRLDQHGVKTLRIAYLDRSRTNAVQKNTSVEKLLEKENISVSATVPVWLLHNAIAGHMKVLVNSLMAMAVLMAFVGSLGLMSTMSMNVFERTREIGVMRAIGATPGKIRTLIVSEGLIIGLFSLVIALAVSVLLSSYLGRFIGNMAFRTPLSLTISTTALTLWVAIVVIGSFLATLYPARRASKITTREALAYE